MREVELGWGKVLLVKDNGEFHALGHKCPHYGAPLVKGEVIYIWEVGDSHPCQYRDSSRALIHLWGLLGWGEVQQDPVQ